MKLLLFMVSALCISFMYGMDSPPSESIADSAGTDMTAVADSSSPDTIPPKEASVQGGAAEKPKLQYS